jgi:exodeoxyribonuclease VII small subunit
VTDRTTDNSSDGQTSVADLTYTQASQELDAIVDFFEHRDVDVDQLVSKLERATAIVDELDSRIRRTRSQVEQLVPRLEAAARANDEEAEGPDDLEDS